MKAKPPPDLTRPAVPLNALRTLVDAMRRREAARRLAMLNGHKERTPNLTAPPTLHGAKRNEEES